MGPSLRPVLARLGLSPTLAINERSRALQAAGRTICRLGLGQSPFPVPEPVVAALREHAAEKDYLPVAGSPALRQAVAAYHRRHDGLEVTLDDVLIGPGSKELMFLLQLVFAGETLLPSPCWVSYAPQVQLAGGSVVWLPTRFEARWRLSAADLDARCRAASRPRLLILNYPGNPDGLTYTAAELQALAQVAQRHDVIVLSDEIYGPLHHRGEHVSLARTYPEGTIVSGGLSKWCGAGGWRLGTFIFPPQLGWLREAVAVAASESFTSVSAPVQYAAVRAFAEGPAIETYLQRSRQVLRLLGTRLVAILQRAGVRVHAPEGAFYLFADASGLRESLAARGITTSEQLARGLLDEAGVAVLPGTCFGRPPEELTLRLAYVDFDGAAALAARDEAELLRVAQPTVAGVERLAAWLAGS